MTIVGNNDTVTSGFNTAFSWEHTVHTSDSAVCPANATLDSVNIRSESTSGTSATIELGIYDVTSGADGAALLHTETVTVDRTSAGVYSATGLGVDFSAHSGKTLAIAHCKPSSSVINCARIAATGNPRSAAADTTLDNPFAENDTNGATVYGLWAELTEASGLTIDSNDASMQRDTNWQMVVSNPSTAPTTGNTTLTNDTTVLTPSSVTGSDPYTLTFPVGDMDKQVDATGYPWTLEITP